MWAASSPQLEDYTLLPCSSAQLALQAPCCLERLALIGQSPVHPPNSEGTSPYSSPVVFWLLDLDLLFRNAKYLLPLGFNREGDPFWAPGHEASL